MDKLQQPGFLKQVSTHVLEEIDSYCANVYDDGHRNHLGSSLIGHECKRYLWYTFRWCYHHKHSGRMQRLFNRGHREESRFVEWLRGIGFEVWDLAEDGKQIRISDCNGHFGGSLDGVCKFPERYGISEPILLEFKTNGTGKGFDELVVKGLALSKSQHFCQTSTYGAKLEFNYVLYLNINKNNDSIYCEFAKLDHKLGNQMIQKADAIVNAEIAPARISDNPGYFKCGYCDFKGICHDNKPIEKNCRSCQHAKPVENAEWFCDGYQAVIPKDVIKVGCEYWNPIV
jgi:hypothetical protein